MEMTELLELIKTTLQKNKVTKLALLAENDGFLINELIDLTFHQDEQIGFRAAWILENIYANHLNSFIPFSIYFLDRFSEQNNLSARRHFVKILAAMTYKKAPSQIKEFINSYNTENIVKTVYSWLIDANVPVGIKSFCLNILANLNDKHNWLKEELLQTMDFLVDKESIGFYAKVKQIRKQLK